MIRPTGTRLLVEAVEHKEEVISRGGIIISPAWNNAPESVQGRVLAVGERVDGISVGDVILVPQFAPTQAREHPQDKTFIVPAEDVIAIIVAE